MLLQNSLFRMHFKPHLFSLSMIKIATLILVSMLQAGCASNNPQPMANETAKPSSSQNSPSEASTTEITQLLADTEWQLVEIQSMDDVQASSKPSSPEQYTLQLNLDGRASMRLNCNRANGPWSITPSADKNSGRFTFGMLATTRAMCPPPSLDGKIAADAEHVSSYLLKDGRLYLSLMADGGIYVWEPRKIIAKFQPDQAIEAAIYRVAPDYTQNVVGSGEENKARYVYERFDLNGDGKQEVLVYLLGSFFCGSGGCSLMIFTESPKGYTLVNNFSITRLPVIVAQQQTRGWQDIFRLESGGGAKSSYTLHRFNGKKYGKGPRQVTDKMPVGKPLFEDGISFEQGIPLEPK